MIVIVDSDGLIGSLNINDIHHSVSTKILLALVKKSAKLIYPATTIAESVTFLQGRLNKPELAKEIIDRIKANQLQIEPVDQNVLQEASFLMNFKGSKHNTLFDAIVAATAKKHNADAIFSFDKFYKTHGFLLAQEL